MGLKLRVNFNNKESHTVYWPLTLHDFPKMLYHDSTNWEWQMFDEDQMGGHDFYLLFTPSKEYNSLYWSTAPTLKDLGDNWRFDPNCQCGAKYERGFEDDHMFFCPKWKKR